MLPGSGDEKGAETLLLAPKLAKNEQRCERKRRKIREAVWWAGVVASAVTRCGTFGKSLEFSSSDEQGQQGDGGGAGRDIKILNFISRFASCFL